MRKQTGNATRRTGIAYIAAALMLFGSYSCGSDAAVNGTDSAAGQDVPKDSTKSMSITEPVSPVPKQTADSIWNGDFIEKYDNGITKKRGYIAGGLASGEWMTFYEDGKQWSMGYYEEGLRTGYGVSWYHDGQKSSEGYYNKGKQVGVWNYWSETNHQLTVKDWGGEMPDTTSHK